MPVISIRIPQLGEGLQEARLVDFLKQPGDAIGRDEAIYVMETDKAVTEVESPAAGRLTKWLVEPNSVVPIGTEIGQMEVADSAASAGSSGEDDRGSGARATPVESRHEQESTAACVSGTTPADISATMNLPKRRSPKRAAGGVRIPPRTKRYLKVLGLLERAAEIPATGTKLMPADVDRWLASRLPAERAGSAAAGSVGVGFAVGGLSAYEERPVPAEQQTLNYRMARGAQLAVAATLMTDVDWTALDAARQQVRDHGGPTSFAMFLWCVVQSMRDFPLLRSTLSSDGKLLRTYRHVNLGVAVAVPENGLRTAVVGGADQLDRATFFRQLADRIAAVRHGGDQADAATTVTVSNMGTADMRWGIPVVVTPAVATLALGQVQPRPQLSAQGIVFCKMATLAMTFDHRILNGVGAADFLNSVRQRSATYQLAPPSA